MDSESLPRADPAAIDALAAELWETLAGAADPIEVADAEWAEWPPHDD